MRGEGGGSLVGRIRSAVVSLAICSEMVSRPRGASLYGVVLMEAGERQRGQYLSRSPIWTFYDEWTSRQN